MGDGLLGIGETASRFGLAGSALRYWEDRGLVTPADRRGRWRRYGPDEVHRIGLIQMWRSTGLMSLDEIAAVLAGTVRGRDWREVVAGRITAIEEQQRRLADAKQHLEHLLTCPDDNPADNCPYLRKATEQISQTAGQIRESLEPPPVHKSVPGPGSGAPGREVPTSTVRQGHASERTKF